MGVGSCLRRNDGGDAGMTEGGCWRAVATVFGVLFFGVFGGDPGGGPIWSGRLVVFGFVQVCSDLFRVVRGDGRG